MAGKTKRAGLIHLWWFVAILFVAIGTMAFLSIYKTHKIIERAETNHSQLVETFRYLRSEPEWKLLTDSLGRHYIDSVRVSSSERASQTETLLIKNATQQLTEYSGILVRETESLNSTLILWATILTLLSIIFTFLGFMELRDRFSAVEEKRGEMDEVINKAAKEVDYKIQDVYSTLSAVQKKRDEMDVVLMKAQNAISTIMDKFEDLSVSAIEDIDAKIEEIDALKQEIIENERVSFYNLSMQSILLKPSEEEKLKAFKSLSETINKDPLLSVNKKYDLLADLFTSIAKILENNEKYNEAIDYYTKALNLKSSYILLKARGLIFRKQGNYEKSLEDFNNAIEINPDFAEGYKYRGDYYRYKNDYKTAIENYTKAIELDPDYLDAYYSRGNVFRMDENTQKALDDYNTIISKEPIYAKAYCKRGIIYKDLNMIEEALDDFERCIELDIDNQSGYKPLAQQEINKIKEIDE